MEVRSDIHLYRPAPLQLAGNPEDPARGRTCKILSVISRKEGDFCSLPISILRQGAQTVVMCVPDCSTSQSRTEAGIKTKSKTSPSNVVFGQTFGTDEVVQSLGSLSSDSSPPSRAGSRAASRGASMQKQSKTTSAPVLASHRSTYSLASATRRASSVATPTSMPSSEMLSSTSSPTSLTSVSHSHTASNAARGVKLTPGEVINGVRVLPQRLDQANPEDVINLVADMLSRLMVHNDSLPLHPSALTRFHSRATPAITIQSYLRRIARYTSLDKACTLILLVYIDRVCERMKGFTICSLTVHRFVCAAVVCASKALCDTFSTNGEYAQEILAEDDMLG